MVKTKKKEDKKSSLTIEQQKCINERGVNLLVSASAGSGKTFVMIERIKTMIENHEANVNELLVVTFTKAAAGEMKARLVQGLEKIENKDDYIKEQLLDVQNASISTLHSFCSKLLKSYFYVIGIDPAFTLIDEIESNTLKEKAYGKLVDNAFLRGDATFFQLFDMFAINRKEDNFKDTINKFYEFLLTLVDSENWFSDMITKSYDLDLDKNVCANFINHYFIDKFIRLRKSAEELLADGVVRDNEKLVGYINALYINLLKIKEGRTFLENRKGAESFETIPRMPTLKDDYAYLKPEVDHLKEATKKLIKEAFDNYALHSEDAIKTKIATTKEHIVALYNYTKEFEKIYSDLKKEKVSLDFSDLEQYTIKLLKDETIRKSIQEKYKYVFVDEYQDTNAIQEAIIQGVSRGDNLFMVGDVKQSIYRFRASEPQIFVDKFNSYNKGLSKKSKAIKLNANFRSNKDVLDFSNEVFSRAMTPSFGGVDYIQDAMFVKGGDNDEVFNNQYPVVSVNIVKSDKNDSDEEDEDCILDGQLPVYSVLNGEELSKESVKKAECEGQIVVNSIKELLTKDIIGSKDKVKRKIDYKDIAILSASRGEYLQTVLKELDKAGIPYTSDIKENIFDNPDIFAVKSFLELVDNRNQDVPLLAVLQSNMFDFSTNELSIIRQANRETRFFFEAFYGACENDKIAEPLKKKVEGFIQTLSHFNFLSQFTSVNILIQRVLEETNFGNEILKKKGGAKTLSDIDKLNSFINGKSYNTTLTEFLINIKENEISFENDANENSVIVTTIHKSKGLEYPVVIVVGCGQKLINRKDMSDFIPSKTLGVGIPFFDCSSRIKTGSICYNAVKIENIAQNLEEKLRLFYVALTRAVNNLIIVGCIGKNNEVVEPSTAKSFLDWVNPVIQAKQIGGMSSFVDFKVNYFNLTYDRNEDASGLENVAYKFSKPNEELMKLVKNVIEYRYKFEESCKMPVKTSVSELLKEEKDEIYVPRLFSGLTNEEAIKKGLAYHKVMQYIDFNIKNEKECVLNIQNLVKMDKLDISDYNLVNPKEIWELLSNKTFVEMLKGNVMREKEFIALTKIAGSKNKNNSDSVLLQGVVDFVSVGSDGAVVVDFKTNNWKDEDRYVSNYATQLNMYSQVLEESLGIKVRKKYLYSFTLGKFIEV